MNEDKKPKPQTGKERRLENLKKGEKTRFTKDKQPPPENKKNGWEKKHKGQKMVLAIMDFAFKGLKNSELFNRVAEYFNIEKKDITIEMMMHFRQIEKAIQQGDTNAYNAVLNRSYGMPKQEMDIGPTKIKVTRS